MNEWKEGLMEGVKEGMDINGAAFIPTQPHENTERS